MASKTPNTTHLKQGKAIPDPIATAKATGEHYSTSTNHNKVFPTEPSNLSASDSKLGGKNRP
jgi:hypothetical protein